MSSAEGEGAIEGDERLGVVVAGVERLGELLPDAGAGFHHHAVAVRREGSYRVRGEGYTIFLQRRFAGNTDKQLLLFGQHFQHFRLRALCGERFHV